MKRKCLIADSVHESLFQMLHNIGWEYDYRPDAQREEIKEHVNKFDGLIIRSKTRVDRDLLGDSSTLKFVGRAGAGIDNIDKEFLSERSIPVLHAAEGNRDAVAEHTIGLLLSLLRRIPKSDHEVRKGIWLREENRGEELSGKTVSILGYGNMGSAFARRLAGFGCKVLAYDKYKSRFGDTFCVEATLDQLFEETDILSIHIPLTPETRQMIGEKFINSFRKDIIIINTARGEIVELQAVAGLLAEGKLRGAALDVLENESLHTLSQGQREAFNYLTGQTNVIFTPHIAGWTVESHVKINVALIKKIEALDSASGADSVS